jgi:hypothetical protein
MKKRWRFWVWENSGWVRLCLSAERPDLSWGHYFRTEEGWSSVETTWHWSDDNKRVIRETCSDGTDCDGRLTQYQTDQLSWRDRACRDMFAEFPEPENKGIMAPHWVKLGAHQRDQYAEMAGY